MQSVKRRILDFLERPGYKPMKAKTLGKKLGVTKKHQPQFSATLQELMDAGRVREGHNGLLRLRVVDADLIAGIVKRTRRGTGFLIPHDAPADRPLKDIYIMASDLGDAHTGDEVLVRLLKRRRSGGQRCGRVEEILERATNRFVGTYFEREGAGFVQIDGTAFAEPIFVGDPGAKGAQPSDKVVLEMLRFPSHLQAGEGVLTRVLGPRGEPGVDELSIIHEFGLPDAFPEAVLEEARIQVEQFDESDKRGRLDLTKETIVTIDPADARDFDDAISLNRSRNGHWHLSVHIADVSHFVPPGSVLDREAQLRGNSVYLPGRVLPMLPEVISNGLASLQKRKVRYAKSVLMEFSPEGIPLHTEFANTAIQVTCRLAYEEVLPILQNSERQRTRVSKRVRELLARMYELAMILRKRRFEAGALELTLPEVRIDFGKDGRVCGAHEMAHDESHQIIEEFMLAANKAVAEELERRGLPFLRRVHGDPSLSKLKALAQFVNVLGYRLERCQSRFDLQQLLNRVSGTPSEQAVSYALLRSMKRAEYTGQTFGHYALAFEHYCHFTSPIRRYPDLVVHRLIDTLLSRRKRVTTSNEVELTKLGKHCSLTERRAESAERELTKVKLLAYMSQKIGEEMDAVITSVERFGFFCRGIEIPAEGIIHISWLSDIDQFDYDAAAMNLIGRRTGRQFRLGDTVRVRVAHVDIDRRELDFRLAARPRRLARKKTKSSAKTADSRQTPVTSASRRKRSAGSRKRRKR